MRESRSRSRLQSCCAVTSSRSRASSSSTSRRRARRADALPLEQLRELLPRRRHVLYSSRDANENRYRSRRDGSSSPAAAAASAAPAGSTSSRPRTSTATSPRRSAARTSRSPRSSPTRTPTRISSSPARRTASRSPSAKVVIQNGLGYDAFMTKLEDAAPSNEPHRRDVADVLGVHGKDANPHLWYDVPRLARIAGAIAAALDAGRPAHARRLPRRPARASTRSSRRCGARSRRSATRFHGAPVAYTEPVPGYLARGRRAAQPRAGRRSRARSRTGTEPSPSAVAAMIALIAKHRIRVLLYNSQAVSPITRAAARRGAERRHPGRAGDARRCRRT